MAVALSGCSAGGSEYAVLDRATQSSDTVPDALRAGAGDEMDLSTSRYVGEHEGTRLWLGKGRTGSTTCLLAYPDDRNWLIGCGAGPSGIDGVDAGRFVFQPDGYPAPENAEAISDNVYVILAD